MPKMLDVSILEDDKVKYNDDIEYVEGDDIYATTKDISPMSYNAESNYTSYIIDKLGKSDYYAPKLVYEDIDLNVDDMSSIASQVSHIYVNFNKEVLSDFKNIDLNVDDEDTEEMREYLKDMDYDGITYFAQNDVISIPQSIYNYIINGNEINAKVSVYNIDKAIVNHDIFKNVKSIEIPKLNFSYIPNKIKYAKIEKSSGGTVFAPKDLSLSDRTYIYVDLPKDVYDKCIIDTRSLVYDIEKEYFCGHSNSNQTKMNVLCKDIATNGLSKVIQFKLLDDGYLVPYFSNKRFIISKYLGLPTIPACIIYDMNTYQTFTAYKYQQIDKKILNDLLKPYIILH